MLWKIQSGHDLVYRQTGGRTDRRRETSITQSTSLADEVLGVGVLVGVGVYHYGQFLPRRVHGFTGPKLMSSIQLEKN